MSSIYHLLPTNAYFSDLNRELNLVSQQVIVQTMYFDPGKKINKIIKTLETLPKKGCQTELIIDSFQTSLATKDKTNNWKKTFDHLQKNGVKISIINPFISRIEKYFPYLKRNHIKIAVVDNISYVGGINFSNQEFEYHDCVIKINNRQIAQKLLLVTKQSKSQKIKTTSVKLDQNTQLLIDGGEKPSLIFQEAQKSMASAQKSIYFISQFVPDGKVAEALAEATKRKVKVIILVPKKNVFTLLFRVINLINFLSVKIKYGNLPIFWHPTMLHAKMLVIDNKIVMTGSHNLSVWGTVGKTKEIMLKSCDLTLVKESISFVQNKLQYGLQNGDVA